VPVLIILCDPKTRVCYWEHFVPHNTEPTEKGWKICVPFDQSLRLEDQERLRVIAGDAIEYNSALENYWSENRLLSESFIYCVIGRDEIEKKNILNIKEFLCRIMMSKPLARKIQGNIELIIDGYDDDIRELWQIPEVNTWFEVAEPVVKYWFYFLRSSERAAALRVFIHSRCGARWVGDVPKVGEAGKVEIDNTLLVSLFERNFGWLNEIIAFLNFPEEENKKISFQVARLVGYEPEHEH
jgi:hypothetical protein